MSTPYWPPGTATGIGSLPGTDPREAARTVAGELPELPHLPELPARGVGADMIGRTAALLVDLATEVVPSGYRVTARPGRDHRRGVDLLRADLDALDEALETTRPAWVKVQAAGPWTLAAGVELRSGHRVLTDHGARREFAVSLAEGLAAHADEVAKRTAARITVQLDEPGLPSVLAGSLPTASGFGTVAAVPEAEVEELLRVVIEALPEPVIVHCCAARPPIGLVRAAGAHAVAVDTARIGTDTALLDAIGEAWDAGVPLLLGVVPSVRGRRADRGGADRGGADRGGADRGGVDRGGVDRGGADRGGADRGAARTAAARGTGGRGEARATGGRGEAPGTGGRGEARATGGRDEPSGSRRADEGDDVGGAGSPGAAEVGRAGSDAAGDSAAASANGTAGDRGPSLRELARPAFDLADQVGFARSRLAELAVPTPACGLAGASPAWARRAMALCRDLGKAFVEPPESWRI